MIDTKYFYIVLMACAVLFYSGTCKNTIAENTQNELINLAPDWSKNAVIYEINVRQYSAEGTFKKVEEDLPRIKNLGVDILWIMPVHPIGLTNRKGSLGSYYSVKDYYAVAPEYGNLGDFKSLVKKAHSLGLKVILDWVANHSAWDNEWINKHPDWYVHDSTGKIITQYDWSDVAKLNYNNKFLCAEMIKALTYWVTETDIDGYRCDVAFLVPVDFWIEARATLQKIKPMFMLAEMEDQKDINPNPRSYFTYAFDANYAWNFMGITSDIEKEKLNKSAFDSMFAKNYRMFPRKTFKMMFLTNHDENSWNGTITEKYGRNWQLYSMLAYTLPQSFPLIYNGEEANLNKRLPFFEKDSINWSDSSRYSWYRNMNQLKHSNKAIANGKWGADMQIITTSSPHIFAFRRKLERQEVVVFVNFSNTSQLFAIDESTDQRFFSYESILDYKLNDTEYKNRYTLPAKAWACYFNNDID